jgi:formate/nitrite transporter
MVISDAYNAHETIEHISSTGYRKGKQRIDHMIIKSFLAGVLLSFGGLFLLIVGGGSAPLAESLGPSIHKMIQAAVFPIGFILLVITGADLFTGNTMALIVSTLNKKTTWFNLIISWVMSFFGNLTGCLFFQYILVYYAGLLSDEPYRSFTMKYAEIKGNIEWHQLFLRGIGGNWLVCLALWMGTSARDLNSKIVGIYLPTWLFITVGFEHSITNMFTVQMGMTLGANLSVGKYILRVLIPVTLGNILGGGFFVGFTYWYLYLMQKADTHLSIDSEPPVNNAFLAVRQNEDVVQSQQP